MKGSSLFVLFTEAIAAINRTVVAGFKRNLASGATGSAYCFKHGAVFTTTGVAFAGITARLATLGFVFKTLFSVELLLSGGEGELGAAIFADDNFVLEHGIPL